MFFTSRSINTIASFIYQLPTVQFLPSPLCWRNPQSPVTSYVAPPTSTSQSLHSALPLDCISRFFSVKLSSHGPVTPPCPAFLCTHRSFLLTYRSLFGVLLYFRDVCELALTLQELRRWGRWRGLLHRKETYKQGNFIVCFLTVLYLKRGLLFILATLSSW